MTTAQETFEAISVLESELERNLIAFRLLAARHGDDTAVAQYLSVLVERPPDVVAGALAVALLRIAGGRS